MSRKHIGIGLALVLFVSVVAIAALWLFPREDSAAKVWAAVQDVCTTMNVADYDVIHTYSIRGALDNGHRATGASTSPRHSRAFPGDHLGQRSRYA